MDWFFDFLGLFCDVILLNNLNMFTPRKCGVKFDPPTLVVFYEVNLTGIFLDEFILKCKILQCSTISLQNFMLRAVHSKKWWELPSWKRLRALTSVIQKSCCFWKFIGPCKTQTADYCFHHANEDVTAIVPLFSSPKNNIPQCEFYTALIIYYYCCLLK